MDLSQPPRPGCVVATALGPIVGGLLAHAGWWRGIFFLNLPLAVAALAVLALRTEESADPEAAGLGLGFWIEAKCLASHPVGVAEVRCYAVSGVAKKRVIGYSFWEPTTQRKSPR